MESVEPDHAALWTEPQKRDNTNSDTTH
jgi:hypothetical protein